MLQFDYMKNESLERNADEGFSSVSDLVDFIIKKIESGTTLEEISKFPELERDPKEKPLYTDDLFELLRLPVEIGLSEENEKLILSIGDEKSIPNEAFIKRSNDNKLCFHSHTPSEYENTESSISAGDIWRVNFRDGKTSILMHTDGFILYGDATRDPETGERLEQFPDNSELLEKFLNNRGYTIIEDNNHKGFSELKREDQIRFSNEFAERSGMIKERISWDDTEGVNRLLDIINLRKEF